jgi:hypothetical protein
VVVVKRVGDGEEGTKNPLAPASEEAVEASELPPFYP